MAFSDCSDSSDPCVIKARNVESLVQLTSGFSPIKLLPNNNSQLEVSKLPFITTLDEIRAIFTKYGPISRVAMDYKCNDNSLNCYLTFENELNSEEALNENERIIGSQQIIVRKYTESETTKGNKRLRTDDNGSDWGASVAATDGWASANQSSSNTTSSWGSTSNSFSDGSSRGRGRGRGGGGSRSCFNCQEEGHMSRECPKPRAGGQRGGPRTCFKCGEEGHMSRECPKGGGRSCFNCGEEGHMSRECPKPRGEGGRGRGGRGRGGSDFPSNSSNTEWANETTSAPQTIEW